MSWRTVVISHRCKLDYKMGYLVVRGEDTKRVFLDEVAVLLLENTAISLTGCLLAVLSEKKIKVVFCDEKRTPTAELVPYYGCHDTTQKIRMQMAWQEDIKGAVWTEIISEKIRKQASFLAERGKGKEAELLRGYLTQMAFYDTTNREGHAAKVYFNGVFGMDFTRGDGTNPINAALNYGYSLVLSAFNREVVANGYLTQLGLFHNNMFNHFNLSCDLMEPFRVLVDRKVCSRTYETFETEDKHAMLDLLHERVTIDGCQQTVLNAIKLYTKSVFDALNDGDVSLIRFPHYEL